jgi:DNA-binding beta-propeller fold protein YncE/4-amino-4-deoxy-L-arabinose transferase-like glycosyltransferase
MKRSVLALSAIALALLAQHYLAESISVADAILLYAVAACLAVRAFAGTEAIEELASPPASIEASWAQRTRGALGIACLLLVLSLIWLRSPAPPFFGTLLWLASLVSFVLAFIGQTGTETVERQEALQRWELVVLGFIVVAGFLLRFYNLEFLPPSLHGDEAEFGLQAIEILEGRVNDLFTVGWYDLPLLGFAAYALSMRVFGVGVFGLRMASVIFGTLSLVPFYFLVRLLFRKQTAVISTFLLAVSHWYVHFSRLGIGCILTSFLELLAFYFLLRGLRFRKGSDFCWSGLAVGFGLYTYYASRLVPLIVPVFLAYRLITEKGFLRSHYRQIVIMIAAATFAFAPLGLYFIEHGRSFMSRGKGVFIFSPHNLAHFFYAYHTRNPLQVLGIQTVHTLSVFNYRGDTSGQYGFREPILDFYTSVFFVLGLAYSLSQWRREHFFLNLWFWATIVAGSILTVDAPFTPRLIGMIPVLFVFAGLALDKTWEQLRQAFKPKGKRYFASAIGLTLLLIAYTNGDAYLNRYIRQQKPMSPPTELARYIQSLGPEYRTYLLGAPHLYFGFGSIRFIARGLEGVDVHNVADEVPIRSEVEEDVVFILLPSHLDALSFIRHYYPNGTLEEHRHVYGYLMFASYRVSGEEIRQRQALVGRYYRGENWQGEPQVIRSGSMVEAGLPSSSSGFSLLSYPFSVIWEGTIFLPRYGRYAFGLDSSTQARFFLDGQLLIEGDASYVEGEAMLPAGPHAIEVWSVQRSADDRAALYWTLPDGRKEVVPRYVLFGDSEIHGLLGSYCVHGDEDLTPFLERLDPIIAFRNLERSGPSLSVGWEGCIHVPRSGRYTFETYSWDGSRVYLDGQLVVDNEHQGRDMRASGSVNLDQGYHDLRVQGEFLSGWRLLELSWAPPGEELRLVPSKVLIPPGICWGAVSTVTRPPAQDRSQRPFGADFILQWGGYGLQKGQFIEPRAVAVDTEGRLYVADTGNHRVQIFDGEGQLLQVWSGGNEAFVEPLAIAVDNHGDVLVLDSHTNWIQRFDAQGHYLGRFGGPLAGFFHARELAVDGQDNVYVADTGFSRIIKYSPDGIQLEVLGTQGSGEGQLMEPVGLAIDANGDIYVADVSNQRIQRLDVLGRYLDSWPLAPSESVNGTHLVLGDDGLLYATEPSRQRFVVFTQDGKVVGRWGQGGQGSGQFDRPTDFALDGRGYLYVADTYNHRVQKWKVSGE